MAGLRRTSRDVRSRAAIGGIADIGGNGDRRSEQSQFQPTLVAEQRPF